MPHPGHSRCPGRTSGSGGTTGNTATSSATVTGAGGADRDQSAEADGSNPACVGESKHGGGTAGLDVGGPDPEHHGTGLNDRRRGPDVGDRGGHPVPD